MENSSQNKLGLKVTADVGSTGTFELKGADGRSFGFVINGDGEGPSFVIAGSGSAIRPVYQRVLMWPATKAVHGRVALLLLDKVSDENAPVVLSEVTKLLSPVKDALFLPSTETDHPDASEDSLRTIENFCAKHGLFSVEINKIDCASL